MSENEFTVGGHRYRARRLDARKQFDVARRLSYTLTMLGSEKKPEFKPTPENFARVFLVSSSFVPQADMDLALNICLSAVTRHVSGDRGWAPVVAGNGSLMFDDIDMGAMLQIVWHVIAAHRLVDFLAAGAQNSKEA